MIASFRHKGLERLFKDDVRRGLPQDMVPRIRDLLAAIETATVVEDLAVPSFRLHSLKGELKGYWAVTVRANWRIVFRFEDGSAYDVEFLDYH